jgi:hypothetical protein
MKKQLIISKIKEIERIAISEQSELGKLRINNQILILSRESQSLKAKVKNSSTTQIRRKASHTQNKTNNTIYD